MDIKHKKTSQYCLIGALILIIFLIVLATVYFFDGNENGKWQDKQDILNGLIESQRRIVNELSDASLYDINLTVSADCLSINGSQKIYYTNTESVSLENIYFYLYPNANTNIMKVSNVKVYGEEANCIYLFGETVLELLLPNILEPNTEIIIEMDYEIDLIPELNEDKILGYFSGVLVLDGFYPVIPVYDYRALMRICRWRLCKRAITWM